MVACDARYRNTIVVVLPSEEAWLEATGQPPDSACGEAAMHGVMAPRCVRLLVED